MYSASDLKRGVIIEFEGAPHLVEGVQISVPTARGGTTVHRTRLRNLKTGQKVDHSFRGGDMATPADVDRRAVQYLYRDPQTFHFMDAESYEQFALDKADLEWETHFLVDDMEGITALFYNEAPLGIELPNHVTLAITETTPAVKGNSATGRTKPATLETGHVIQVPEHVVEGTKVSVDTRTGEFIGRVKS